MSEICDSVYEGPDLREGLMNVDSPFLVLPIYTTGIISPFRRRMESSLSIRLIVRWSELYQGLGSQTVHGPVQQPPFDDKGASPQ